MPPRVLVEGVGDISDDVIYGEGATKLGVAANGQAQPSQIVVRDLGGPVLGFVSGRRVTVDLVESLGAFADPFDRSTTQGDGTMAGGDRPEGPADSTYGLGPSYRWSAFDSPYAAYTNSLVYCDGNRVVIPANAYDSYRVINDDPWPTTAEAAFSFYVPAAADTAATVPAYGLWYVPIDWATTDPWPSMYVFSNGDGTWQIGAYDQSLAAPGASPIATFTPDVETMYRAKVAYAPSGAASYKVWKVGDVEPVWLVSGTTEVSFDTASVPFSAPGGDPYSGDLLVDFWDGSPTVTCYFDDLEISSASLDVSWAGYLLKARRQFWFDVDQPDTENRRWVLDLVDVNRLFSKRVVAKQSDPAVAPGPLYKTETYDDTIIAALVSGWLDLSTDDLDLTSLVDRVAVVNPSPTCITGQSFRPWSAGMSWGEAMDSIAQIPAAVYGLVPARPLGESPFARLLYADAESADAPYILSDRPDLDAGSIGYRDCTIFDDGTNLANDALCWGAGKGIDSMVFSRVASSSSIAAHGLWQTSQTLYDIWCQDTIGKVADSIVFGSPTSLRGQRNDIRRVELTVDRVIEAGVRTFRAAQRVRFINHEYGIDETLPIRQLTLDFPGGNVVRQGLVLSTAYDRWGFHNPPPPTYNPGFPGGGGGSRHRPHVCKSVDEFDRYATGGFGNDWTVFGTAGYLTDPGVQITIDGDIASIYQQPTLGAWKVGVWRPLEWRDGRELLFRLRAHTLGMGVGITLEQYILLWDQAPAVFSGDAVLDTIAEPVIAVVGGEVGPQQVFLLSGVGGGGGGVEPALSGTSDDWLFIRLRTLAGVVWVKAWTETDIEPEWDPDNTYVVNTHLDVATYPAIGFMTYLNTGAAELELSIDYIRQGDCVPTSGPCGTMVIDDFERSVAAHVMNGINLNDTSTWGTTPSAGVLVANSGARLGLWSISNQSSALDMTSEVTGGVGTLDLSGVAINGALAYFWLFSGKLPLDDGSDWPAELFNPEEFELAFRVRYPVWQHTPAFDENFFTDDISFDVAGITVTLHNEVTNFGSEHQVLAQAYDSNTGGMVDLSGSPAASFEALRDDWLTVTVSRTGGQVRVVVSNGITEYIFSAVLGTLLLGGFPYVDPIRFNWISNVRHGRAAAITGLTVSNTFELDDLVTRVCNAPTVGPEGATVCETPEKLSASTFQLTYAATPGTLRVWRNGTVQRPGIDFFESSNPARFYFADAVLATDAIEVCYLP